jgi:hypothetical protein
MPDVLRDCFPESAALLSLFDVLSKTLDGFRGLNEFDKTGIIGGPVMGFSVEVLKQGKSRVKKSIPDAAGDIRREAPVLTHHRRGADHHFPTELGKEIDDHHRTAQPE